MFLPVVFYSVETIIFHSGEYMQKSWQPEDKMYKSPAIIQYNEIEVHL